MPLYEYACGDCGSHLEIRQRMTEDALTTCPRCDANALERLVSQSSFALKGGGWYADGYGQGAKKADDKSKSAETKPAAKADKADKKESKAKSATDVKPSAST